MPKKVHHVVTRPGLSPADPAVNIPVAEDLVSEPGIPQRKADVSFYGRVYPLESQNIEKAADREWVWTVFTPEIYQTKCAVLFEHVFETFADSASA